MQILDNQPISFRETLETDSPCNLGDKKTYCQLFENGDRLKAQWIVDPCSTIECEDEVGQNIAGNECADWTLDGMGTWSCAGGILSADGSGSGYEVTQIVPTIAGQAYLVTFTVSNLTVGSVGIKLGSAATYTYYNANGTYSILLTDTSDHILSFITGGTPPNFFDGDVSEVIVSGLGCYEADNSNFFTDEENNSICHVTGAATILTVNEALEVNKYYGIQILVSGQTQGSIRIIAGTTVGEWFEGNGYFTSFLVADTSTLSIEMDTDFDGCVSFVKADLYPSVEDWEIGLFDLDGTWIREIQTYGGTNFLTYDNNFLTLDWYIPSSAYYAPSVAEGCYKICLIDPCVEHSGFVYSSSIFQDDFDNGTLWSLQSGITISGGEMTFISNLGGGTKQAEIISFSYPSLTGCTFTVRINFSAIDALYLNSTLIINIGGVATPVTIDAGVISDLFIEETITAGAVGGFSLEFDNSVDPSGGSPEMSITSMFIKVSQECFFENVIPDYCSNCISIKEEQPCTLRFEAYCDEAANGFNFTNFSLIGRLRTIFVNPFSKSKNENYKFSNGSYYKNYSEKDKIWEVLFDYVDETTHDWLATALLCDHLKIYNPVTFPNNDEHIWLEDSYKPEWDKEGRQKVAQSRIELRKKSGHLTNSNCS